jgi:hypothetical protein
MSVCLCVGLWLNYQSTSLVAFLFNLGERSILFDIRLKLMYFFKIIKPFREVKNEDFRHAS